MQPIFQTHPQGAAGYLLPAIFDAGEFSSLPTGAGISAAGFEGADTAAMVIFSGASASTQVLLAAIEGRDVAALTASDQIGVYTPRLALVVPADKAIA